MIAQVREGIKSQIEPLKRYVMRITRTPFADKSQQKLIVHCCHHKVGTVWFKRVLANISRDYGLNFFHGKQEDLPTGIEVFLQDHSRVDFSPLPDYIGSHMIRDPRDMIISGYFYHLWTKEAWVHEPQEVYGNKSYQQYLNSASQAEGLLSEIERFAEGADLRDMMNWNYDDPNILEIRYENIMNNEEEVFRQIFQHYGFSESAIANCLDITKKLSFEQYKKKKEANKSKSHLRSGKTGEWRDLFEEQHKALCKERFGQALIKLGYEKDLEW